MTHLYTSVWIHWRTETIGWCLDPYLTQSALQLAQEVVITQVDSLVVNVINPKFEFLYDLKVVVDDKLFGKPRIEAILDFLCPCDLMRKPGLNFSSTKVQM